MSKEMRKRYKEQSEREKRQINVKKMRKRHMERSEREKRQINVKRNEKEIQGTK